MRTWVLLFNEFVIVNILLITVAVKQSSMKILLLDKVIFLKNCNIVNPFICDMKILFIKEILLVQIKC